MRLAKWVVREIGTNAVLCEALDRGSAVRAAEWFRAAGHACVVRAAE